MSADRHIAPMLHDDVPTLFEAPPRTTHFLQKGRDVTDDDEYAVTLALTEFDQNHCQALIIC